VLPAILNQGPVSLSAQGQMDVSMWAVKTALLLELATKRLRAHSWMPMNHFPYLREENHPPPGTQVWLFRMNSENKIPAWHRTGVVREGTNPVGYMVTFTLGYLGVQVIGRKFLKTRTGSVIFNQNPLKLPPAFDGVLQQILPVSGRGIVWPPPLFVAISQLGYIDQWPNTE
jgi:hypothetical protein